MISAIAYKQKVIVICKSANTIRDFFCYDNNIIFLELPTNDTWIRDYGPISIYNGSSRELLDFTFNAWGGKFDYALDNNISRLLYKKLLFSSSNMSTIDFVLEGGSIESVGNGTLLTTSKCLLNENRNSSYSKKEIEKYLIDTFNLKQILWLHHGSLIGDDTDAHIDTLARFVNEKTIVYVKCYDEKDIHFVELQRMESELQSFRTLNNEPYQLIPLPLPSPKYKNNQRLAATYANFLITNYSILLPVYNDNEDAKMIELFKKIFSGKEVIPINAVRLIEEGGSIHCSTMHLVKENLIT